MYKKIAVMAGDGIGPEIVSEGIKVLNRIAEKFGHKFDFEYVLAGGCAIDKVGEPLPKKAVDTCLGADSVLLGAVGGPKWDGLSGTLRPERALLGIRNALGVYANIRPAKLFTALKDACPLRADIANKGLDLVVVRELIGGIYFGERKTFINEKGEKQAYDTMTYSESEIERIAHVAFKLAKKRRNSVISVDKANVLDSSRLWREVLHRVKESYPDVKYSDILVDNCAMQLIKDPSQFDVIVTENMFGDILSDETSMLTGSIGMIPSMSLRDDSVGLYEPIHGSAPDIAGQNKANPIATILSCAMMLRYSFALDNEALAVEKAVEEVLLEGYATADIMSDGKKPLSCSQMGDLICSKL